MLNIPHGKIIKYVASIIRMCKYIIYVLRIKYDLLDDVLLSSRLVGYLFVNDTSDAMFVNQAAPGNVQPF